MKRLRFSGTTPIASINVVDKDLLSFANIKTSRSVIRLQAALKPTVMSPYSASLNSGQVVIDMTDGPCEGAARQFIYVSS
jgi:hypothetical protein